MGFALRKSPCDFTPRKSSWGFTHHVCKISGGLLLVCNHGDVLPVTSGHDRVLLHFSSRHDGVSLINS